jgi:hypothetical protein
MEENQSSNQNSLKIGIVVLLGALGLLAYLYYGSKNENTELQKVLSGKLDELSTTRIKLDSISRNLDEKIAEVTALGGNIEELEKIKAQLEQDKKNLRANAGSSVKKYEAKIAEYETFLAEKDVELAKLREENQELALQYQTEKEEKQKVIAQNTTLSFAKDSLNQKVSEVSTVNEDLRKKVTVGSALKAVNVQVAAISSRGKERTGEVKNKRIDQLKVSFILPTNPLAETNNKEIFLRVTDPEGGVLNDMGRGGVLNFANQEIGYTLKESVAYTRNDQKVDLFYKKDMAFKPGEYKIELFSEGFKIGNGSFAVK